MTFESFCDDGKRFSCWFLCFPQSLVDIVIIMTINGYYFEIECFKFSYVFINVMSEHRFLALPKAINVKNSDKVIQLFMRGKIGGFPGLSFCEFSITRQHIRFASISFAFGNKS